MKVFQIDKVLLYLTHFVLIMVLNDRHAHIDFATKINPMQLGDKMSFSVRMIDTLSNYIVCINQENLNLNKTKHYVLSEYFNYFLNRVSFL